MSAEVKKASKEIKTEEPKAEEEKGFKALLKIAEVRMLLYVIPVALVLLVVALLLNGK
jgi:hypothetical protein